MGLKENFSKNVESKKAKPEKLKEELSQSKNVIAMYKNAETILERMEGRIGDALDEASSEDLDHRFDGNLSGEESTRYERKANDLHERALLTIEKMGALTSIWEALKTRYSEFTDNPDRVSEEEVDLLVAELMEIQKDSINDVSTDLNDGGLDWYRHEKREIDAEYTGKMFAKLANKLEIKGISVEGEDGGYEDFLESLPLFRYAFARLSVADKKELKDIQIVIMEDGFGSRVDPDEAISIDPGLTSAGIANDITYEIWLVRNRRQKLKIDANLSQIASSNNLKEISTPYSDDIDFADLKNEIGNIKSAISSLDKKTRDALSDIPIVLEKYAYSKKGLTLNADNKIAILLNLADDSEDLIEDIKNGVASYDKASVLNNDLMPDVDAFLSDPAFENIDKIKVPGRWDSGRAKKEMRMMIARNLYENNLEYSNENVRSAYNEIIRERTLYENVTAFKGRNVLLVGNNEKYRDHGEKYKDTQYKEMEKKAGGDDSFLSKKTVDAIKKQAGKDNVQEIRPTSELLSPAQTNKKILDAIRNTPPPFTFVIDGHGFSESVTTAGGGDTLHQIKSLIMGGGLTARKIAKCIVERYKKFPQLRNGEPEMKDQFFFVACDSTKLKDEIYINIRNICKEGECPAPVLFASTEYGQYSYYKLGSGYGNLTFEKVFDLSSGKITTLGTIMKNDAKGNSNPTLHVGDGVQISRLEEEVISERPYSS